MKAHLKAISFLLFLFAVPCLVFPNSLSTSIEFSPDQPIETKMNLGLFGFLGGGMNYFIGGKPISRYEDFKTLIYAKNDMVASDLIREAHETHFAAWMFYAGGLAAGIDVGLNFKPAPLLNIQWFDRAATGFVAAQFFWAVGALFDSNAEARKYNAVQRYNHLLKEKDEAFLGLKPQVCQVGQGLGLDLGRDF